MEQLVPGQVLGAPESRPGQVVPESVQAQAVVASRQEQAEPVSELEREPRAVASRPVQERELRLSARELLRRELALVARRERALVPG